MADAMKLVPCEPTEAMIEAGNKALFREFGIRAGKGPLRTLFAAMLAASPPAREEAPTYADELVNASMRRRDAEFGREEAPALIDTLNAASAKVALNPERAAEIRANWTNGEEAPAEGTGEREDLKAANKDHCRAVNTLTLEAIELERQIADLRAYVVKANSGFEEYERKFYLASDEVERLKLAICGGEDVPGSINAVSVDDCERFITEERGRHIDTEARLEYVRASRDGAAGRAHDLYMALAEVKEQVVTYPLSDNSTCMCGAPLGGHNVGSGHAPVSLADHAISLIVEGIDKALRFGAPTDGRPDDYEGPDAGMHDTEIVERDND